MTPVSIGVALTLALLASFLVAREILFPVRPSLGDLTSKTETWRVDPPLRGAVLVLLIALAVFFLVGTLLGVAAQHVPGTVYTSRAIVTSTAPNYSARNPCLVKVIANAEAHVGRLKFCFETTHGGAIGPENLRAADAISVRLRDTPLGTVVEFASRVR